MDIPTLRMRSFDRLDFYDVAVWCLRPALLVAIEGKVRGRAPRFALDG
ncbi:DUF6900 domain-containing protein [Mycetohabitans rhizoxinica]